MLNGIDISDCQGNIDVSQVPAEFVIVQHSCGTFIDPTFSMQAEGTLNSGKELGIYHFITGAEGEIETFINGVRPYAGRAVLALDWEAGTEQCPNTRWGDWRYLRRFAEAIQSELGTNPLLYASASQYAPLKSLGDQLNCGLWVAQYATEDPTGFQEAPWNEQCYDMAVFQYSDNGRLPGYPDALDLDLFYGDRNAWREYAKSSMAQSPGPVEVHEVKHETEVEKPVVTAINENELTANKDVLPWGRKIVLTNVANNKLYLTSHDGGLVMSSDPMPFYVQRNADNSISLADPWGNWITVPSDVKNGDLPSVVKGNGSLEQKWMASPFQLGIKLTSVVNDVMNLDLPNDDDADGKRVQVWGEWAHNLYCPNQTWLATIYEEPAPAPHTEPAPKKEEVEKHVEQAPKEQTPEKKEVKVEKPTDSDAEARIIADLKDLSDISQTQDVEVGDQIADVVQAMFHTKKATKKMASWIFVLGSIFALAATVLLILSGCHILPASGGVIAGIVSTIFSAFAHAMGITLAKNK